MENKVKYQPIVLFIVCLAITSVTAKLKGDRESAQVFKLGKPVVVPCEAENPEETKLIEWFKIINGTSKKLEDIKSLKGRYSVKPAEGKFIIDKTHEDDVGNYSCSLHKTEIRTISLKAYLIVKIPDNIYVVEDEKLEIICLVKGDDPIITWTFKQENGNETVQLEESERVKFADFDKIKDAKLIIEDIKQNDRGFYTCVGTSANSPLDKVTSEGQLRVKDKFAALWPFIGICAEVFVLCAIILIYEKRRNKDSDNDSDTDQGDQKK